MPRKKKKNLLPLIIKSLLILLIIAAAGGIGLLCYVEGGELIRTSRRFTVKKIVIDPTLRFIQHRDLQVIQGQSIFDVDLQDMESRLMLKYPEISELRVERKFPDEIHLVAKKRMQLAQVPFRQSFLVVDDEGVVLAKKEKRDKELPAIEGFKIPRGPVELGSRIRHQRLRTALEIITSFNENAALSSYRIDNLDIDQSSKIMVYLDRDIKAILDDQRVDRKINVLGFVLTQGNLDLREVNYIDLRFKDPIIGKK
ncbi:MAG: cell division protein FtsQ/DivIB [Candidatus Omnitrophica bacterium]|nr:cell division protein FtsQ/DivIB [Candidatus Omnitrophota bacterium]